MPKSTVYFIKDITPENVVKIYEKLGKELTGKIAEALGFGTTDYELVKLD